MATMGEMEVGAKWLSEMGVDNMQAFNDVAVF